MIFKQIEVGNMQNFCYIAADEESKEAAIIDAGFDPELLVEEAKKLGLKIKYILLTHNHYDHMQSTEILVQLTNAIVCIHKNDAQDLHNLKIKTLEDNEELNIGKIKIKADYLIHQS